MKAIIITAAMALSVLSVIVPQGTGLSLTLNTVAFVAWVVVGATIAIRHEKKHRYDDTAC